MCTVLESVALLGWFRKGLKNLHQRLQLLERVSLSALLAPCSALSATNHRHHRRWMAAVNNIFKHFTQSRLLIQIIARK